MALDEGVELDMQDIKKWKLYFSDQSYKSGMVPLLCLGSVL